MAERAGSEVEPTAVHRRFVDPSVAATAWAALDEGFTHAASTRPEWVETLWWTLGGRRVRARVVGARLGERVGQAFAHLRMAAPALARPDLGIDVWAGEDSGVPLTPGTVLDSIPGWHDSGGTSTVSTDGRHYIHALFDSRAVLDRQAGRILCYTASSGRMSLYEQGKPFRVLLTVWLHDRSIQIVHAALVSHGGRGILLPGPGGAGKSTSALASLLAGFQYLGDDYVGLERHADGSFTGHSVYDSTWLDPAHLPRFPSLVPHAISGSLSWEWKRLVHLSDVCPERLGPSAPLRLLVLPRVTHERATRTRPASRADALLAMVPSSVLELTPRVGAQGFARLTALVNRLPTHWLELGDDPSEIPGCLERLLSAIDS